MQFLFYICNYIINIIIYEYIIYLKSIFREDKTRKEKNHYNFCQIRKIRNDSTGDKNGFIELMKDTIKIWNIKLKNKITDSNNKLKLQLTKHRKFIINERNNSNRIYIIKNIMKLIIIFNLFSQAKNYIFDVILSHYSKIILKVRGIGDNAILGDMSNYIYNKK